MANNILLLVTTNKNNNVAFIAQAGGPSAWFYRKLSSLFQAFSLGAWNSSVVATPNLVAAAGLITFTGRPVADETMLVLNTTLTAKDSGANGTTQFNTAVSNTTTATNLAACINANTTLNKQVIATSALGVVTITALIPGVVGNGFQLSEGMTTTAATAFTGGTQGTVATYHHGL